MLSKIRRNITYSNFFLDNFKIKKMNMNGQKIVDLAFKEVGVVEYPKNSNKTKYGEWFGYNGVAWCAIFVSWVYSQAGFPLKKILPPLNKNAEQRVIGINVGYKVELCNNIEDFSYEFLDFDFYIKEAYKLIEPFNQKHESLFDF